MMPLTLMMSASPNVFGKHRNIATPGRNIIMQSITCPEIKCIFPLDKCTHVGYNNPNIDKAFEQKPVTV